MIKIFDPPIYMTVEEAEKKFHPNSVVMIKCEVEQFATKAGYVAAAEVNGGEDYRELRNFENVLMQDPDNGEISFINTDDPFAGEWLCISQNF